MQNNKPIILILEDDMNRIDWLAKIFSKEAKLMHTNTVKEFVELFEKYKNKICLIIFDHDLPIFDFPKDATKEVKDLLFQYQLNLKDINGENGFDAALKISFYNNLPCLIWSYNETGRKNIINTLTQKGYSEVHEFPLLKENYFDIRKIIGIALSEFKLKNNLT